MAYIGTSPSQGVRHRYLFTATSGQTTFTGADDDGRTLSYTDTKFMDVFLNGVLLDPNSDYTATTGNSVVLTSGAATDDLLEVIAFDTFSVFSGTFGGDVTVGGAFDATTATFDRASTDGTIIDLQKDGTSVGSIGIANSDLYIDGLANHSGIRFQESSLIPRYNGAVSNNAVDLGTSGNRFKDLYLGGGAYLGGTGAANYLDDYEEGTWTPTINVGSATNRYTNYTKIGRQVFLSGNLSDITDSTAASDLIISGLPYSAASETIAVGSVMLRYVNTGGYEQVNSYIGQGSNILAFYMSDTSNNASWTPLEYKDANQTWDIIFSIVYIAA